MSKIIAVHTYLHRPRKTRDAVSREDRIAVREAALAAMPIAKLTTLAAKVLGLDPNMLMIRPDQRGKYIQAILRAEGLSADRARTKDDRRRTKDADREPNQSDLNSAARGLNMLGKSIADLEDIVRQHEGKDMFASKVIVAAARQMIAAKRRMGARDESEHERWRTGR